jgi:hypothetical protein
VSADEVEEFPVALIAAEDLDEAETFVVAFGQGEDGDEGSLTLQASHTPDLQDRALRGYDTYSISTNDGLTTYGGIESLVLQGDTLDVALSAEAAGTLDLPTRFRILLHDVDPGSRAKLAPGLRHLFELAGDTPPELVLDG